jgi:hypothetical protein
MILTREYTSALQVREDGDGRVLHGPVLPWNVEARVLDRGRLVVEVFERGALAGTDPGRVPLTATHPATPARSPSASRWSWKSATTPHGAPGG